MGELKKSYLLIFVLVIFLLSLHIVNASTNCVNDTAPVDILFLIDHSIQNFGITSQLGTHKSSEYLLYKFNSSKDRVGIISYNSKINYILPLTSDFNLINNTIYNSNFSGLNPDLNLSLNTAFDYLTSNGRPNALKTVLVIGTGDWNTTGNNYLGNRDKALALGIPINSIMPSIFCNGLFPCIQGSALRINALVALSYPTGYGPFVDPDYTQLDYMFSNISSKANISQQCNQRNPVLLVHGYCSDSNKTWKLANDKDTFNFEQKLKDDGFDVYDIDFSQPTNLEVTAYVKPLINKIQQIKQQTGADKVDIVAHSMGGLITRWYIQKMGKAYKNDIGQLIMIATPNHGSSWSNLEGLNPDGWGVVCEGSGGANMPGGNAATDMHPKSPFLAELNYNEHSFNISSLYLKQEIIGNKSIKSFVKYNTLGGTGISTEQYDRDDKAIYKREINGTLSWINVSGLIINGGLHLGDHYVPLNSLKLKSVGCNQYFGRDHSAVHEDLAIFNRVVELLQNISLVQGDDCNITHNTPTLSLSPLISDSIIQEDQKVYDVFIENGAINLTFGLKWENNYNNLDFSLIDPNNNNINPTTLGITYKNNSNSKMYVIEYPLQGNWKIKIYGSSVSDVEQFSTRSSYVTDGVFIIKDLSDIYSKKPGDFLNIQAFLFNDTEFNVPVLNASINITILRPNNTTENINLYDDGMHNDYFVNDGVYGNTYLNTNISGVYEIQGTAIANINSPSYLQRFANQLYWIETYPDLIINQSSIIISPVNLDENRGANISIEVYNMGDKKATNISLYLLDQYNNSNMDMGEVLISELNPGLSYIATFNWNSTYPSGDHTIIASVSTFDSLEKDYDNNDAFLNISILNGLKNCDNLTVSGIYKLATNININDNSNCLYINSSNVVLDCLGFSVIGNNTGTGIYLTNSRNIKIKNCNLSKLYYGINIMATNYSNFNNNILYKNYYGIAIGNEGGVSFSTGNMVSDNNLNNNSNNILSFDATNTSFVNNTIIEGGNGFYISGFQSGGSKISILGNKIIKNEQGIQIFSLVNSIIANNQIINNSVGIIIGGSATNNNIIENNTIINSTIGIRVYTNTKGNTIKSNIIAFNNEGIHLSFTDSNTIYNNNFTNIINAVNNEGCCGTNNWNVTKNSGTNIIGGPSIGGNYWSDYIGVDNNGDGLGDTNLPYKSNGTILYGGDFMPLVYFNSNPVSSCQEINIPGNYYLNSNITLTTQFSTNCIEIVTSNVTFDCKGNSIIGSGAAWSGTNAFYVTGNNSIVKNCVLSDLGRGIATGGSNILILNNTIYNMWEGINAGGNNNVYEYNNVYNNIIAEGRAFTIWWGPKDHIIRGNRFTNSNYGIDLGDNCGGNPFPCITNNTFYNNYIAGNVVNARDFTGYNLWNITKISTVNIIGGPFIAGNYWGDYLGNDTNGDGLGDQGIPYNSNSEIQNGGDFKPLKPINRPPTLSKFIPSNSILVYNQPINIVFNSTYPDPDPNSVLSVSWYVDSVLKSNNLSYFSYNFMNVQYYNITLYVSDFNNAVSSHSWFVNVTSTAIGGGEGPSRGGGGGSPFVVKKQSSGKLIE